MLFLLFSPNITFGEVTTHYNTAIEQYIQWIVANSPYKDTQQPRPVINMVTIEYMKEQWFEITGEHSDNIRAIHIWTEPLCGPAQQDCTPAGVPEKNSTILLPLDFNIDKIKDQRTLVHETTHYLQHTQGTVFSREDYCNKMLEYYARQISNEYIYENRSKLLVFFHKDDAIMEEFKGTCR